MGNPTAGAITGAAGATAADGNALLGLPFDDSDDVIRDAVARPVFPHC